MQVHENYCKSTSDFIPTFSKWYFQDPNVYEFSDRFFLKLIFANISYEVSFFKKDYFYGLSL